MQILKLDLKIFFVNSTEEKNVKGMVWNDTRLCKWWQNSENFGHLSLCYLR